MNVLQYIVICVIISFFFTTCASEQQLSTSKDISANSKQAHSDFLIDEVEDFSFEELEEESGDSSNSGVFKGASFKISISSRSYELNQLKHYNLIQPVRSSKREASIRKILTRYNRTDLVRSAHVLISIYPSSGRLKQYRIIKSTYFRELDTVIMKDLAGLKFKPVRGKIPSVIYVTYMVRLYKDL